jgi:glyoxylase-like metal-dependent hydrolase (beta-lactamase superfamily II)
VLIDPLPLVEAEFARLGAVDAIVLTCGSHQRSAWRLRRELGVQVYAPALVREVEEEPDVRYEEGDELPAGLRAYFTPGAGTTQHSLLHGRVLFTADLFVNPPGAGLDFVPDEYLADPAQARESARRLLELDFDLLCTGHGKPVAGDPKSAIGGLLERRG